MSNLCHLKAKYSHMGYTFGRQVKKGVGSKTIYSYFFKRERCPSVNQYLHIHSFSITPDFRSTCQFIIYTHSWDTINRYKKRDNRKDR